MKSLPISLIEQFAEVFAYGKRGFQLKEVTPFFENYQAGLPSPSFEGIRPRKADHFVTVVKSMTPKNQRYALLDLCINPPDYLKELPDKKIRKELLKKLLAVDTSTPLGPVISKLLYSNLSLRAILEEWWIATSRIRESPASAITAARTLVETTLKTIIKEMGEEPDESGKIHKLFKQIAKMRPLHKLGT